MNVQRISSYGVQNTQNNKNKNTSFKALYQAGRVIMDGTMYCNYYSRTQEVFFLKELLSRFAINNKRKLGKVGNIHETVILPANFEKNSGKAGSVLWSNEGSVLVDVSAPGLRTFSGDNFVSVLCHRPQGVFCERDKRIFPESFVHFPAVLPRSGKSSIGTQTAWLVTNDYEKRENVETNRETLKTFWDLLKQNFNAHFRE